MHACEYRCFRYPGAALQQTTAKKKLAKFFAFILRRPHCRHAKNHTFDSQTHLNESVEPICELD